MSANRISLSQCALDTDALRFSNYADKICRSLEDTQIPSDRILVAMVRLQQVSESIVSIRNRLCQLEFSVDELQSEVAISSQALETYKNEFLGKMTENRTYLSLFFTPLADPC